MFHRESSIGGTKQKILSLINENDANSETDLEANSTVDVSIPFIDDVVENIKVLENQTNMDFQSIMMEPLLDENIGL